MDEFARENFNTSWDVLQEILCKEYNISCPTVAPALVEDSTWNLDIPISIYVVSVLLTLFGLASNLVLFRTIRNSKKLQQKSVWRYVFNLTIVDMMIILTIPMYLSHISYFHKFAPKRVNHILFPTIDVCLSSASTLSVAAASIEFVNSSDGIQKCRNKRTERIIISAIWVYSALIFILAGGRMLTTNGWYHQAVFWLPTCVVFFGAVITTAVCHVIILSRWMYKTCHPRACEKEIVRSIWLVKNRILLLVAPLPFFLGWTFYLAVQTFEELTGQFLQSNDSINTAMLFIPWVISALNPLMYILSSPRIREELRKTWQGKNCFSSQEEYMETLNELTLNESSV